MENTKKAKRKEVLSSYIKSKIALDELKKEVDGKKKAVIKVLLAMEDHKAFISDRSISLRRSVKYEYSKKVGYKEEALKADKEVLSIMKKDEVLDGTAEIVEGSETFTPVVKGD